MNENIDQNIQSQIPPQGEPMPSFASVPPMSGMPRQGWRRKNFNVMNGYTFFPSHLAKSGFIVGAVSLAIILFFFGERLMPAYMYLIFILELAVFYMGSKHYSKEWAKFSAKTFVKYIFWIGLLLRIPFTLYHHIDNVNNFGLLYYDNLADIEVYVGLPKEAVDNILQKGDWNFLKLFNQWIALDDLGAPILNTFILLITGNVNPCGAVLVVNVILGAITPIFMYHIARRHFGEDVGKLTGLFCMLNPNMIWWCSSMMKETQMVFFACWFMDRMDAVLMRGKVSVAEVIPVALIGMYVFLYRAALGILLFMAFAAALVLMSQKMVSYGKKIMAGVLVAIVLLLGFGQQMQEQAQTLRSQALGEGQKENMEWRTRRTHGNAFAKYASKAVFAPLIFTIPFPTLTYTHEGQIPLMEVAGGNLIKNMLSFLVILCMFQFLLSGDWRRHVFPIAYLIGYLIILAFSVYAQSGRFHMPAIPFEMMFAAYFMKLMQQNVRLAPHVGGKVTYTRWYNYWCIACIAFTVFWQWFKLKGQGLI